MRTLAIILLLLSPLIAGPQQRRAPALKTYSNPGCGFSFTYPAAWTIVRKPLPARERSVPGCDIQLSFRAKGKRGHAVSLSIEEKEFAQAARDQGFEKSGNSWVHDGIMERDAEEIVGDGWKGLSITYSARCFGGKPLIYQAMGEGSVAFASSGKRTVIVEGGECDSSDPEALGWVVKSLRFLPNVPH